MSHVYCTIATRFAVWASRAAMNRAPEGFKSNADVRRLLQSVDFRFVLDSRREIIAGEFDLWHKRETLALHANTGCKLPIGWCTKLLNVYLKTTSYVGDMGRPGIRGCLHPPIDNDLLIAIRSEPRLQGERDLHEAVSGVAAIAHIQDYDSQYMRLIQGFRMAAERLGCWLFEVEQLWGSDDEAPPNAL